MPEVDVEILHETQSLCPVCLRRLDARYVRRGQSILLERTCPERGTFAVDIWHERTERTSRRRVSTAGHGPKRRRTRVNRAQLSGTAAPMITVCVRPMPSIPARAWWK